MFYPFCLLFYPCSEKTTGTEKMNILLSYNPEYAEIFVAGEKIGGIFNQWLSVLNELTWNCVNMMSGGY